MIIILYDINIRRYLFVKVNMHTHTHIYIYNTLFLEIYVSYIPTFPIALLPLIFSCEECCNGDPSERWLDSHAWRSRRRFFFFFPDLIHCFKRGLNQPTCADTCILLICVYIYTYTYIYIYICLYSRYVYVYMYTISSM